MRVAALVLLVPACFSKPDEPPGAGAFVSCPGAPFGPIDEVVGTFNHFTSVVAPMERFDRKELFFGATYSADGLAHIFVVKRDDPTKPYDGTEAEVAFSVTGTMDVDPTLTADGKEMFFIRSGNDQLWEIARASIDDPFSNTAQLDTSGLFGSGVVTITPNLAGTTLYYTDPSDGNFYAASRPDVASVFAMKSQILQSGIIDAAIAPDELELYYSPNGVMGEPDSYMTRTAVGDPFVGGTGVNGVARRTSISPDGKRLLFAQNNQILARSRTCP